MAKHVHDSGYCRNAEIFSGPCSEDMWKSINEAKSKKDLREALYLVCCRLQDLESKIERLARKPRP